MHDSFTLNSTTVGWVYMPGKCNFCQNCPIFWWCMYMSYKIVQLTNRETSLLYIPGLHKELTDRDNFEKQRAN